ncbi:Probable UDP-3-O-acyl-N-acetylglucosamine deacetylase 1, mitochondrial [Ancistrocladus abbreviatus]
MALSVAFKSSAYVSWMATGKLQKTIAKCTQKSGVALHSGKFATVRLLPELAGKGRHFDIGSNCIPASIKFFEQSPLCTTLCANGFKVRTVEHLLSALEAADVDNCRIEIASSSDDSDDRVVEVPILDGSAREWVESIQKAGLEDAVDQNGNNCEKMVPFLNEPVHVWRNDSFVAAFPSPTVHITGGINFPQVPHIGCQWFSSAPIDSPLYATEIASSRTFCIYEEVEKMRNAGLIKGGSVENAIICSASKGWLNPPLHFPNEPCRHKVLDLIGDLSLFARCGSQGVPVAHIIAYKAGHALHAEFVRCLSKIRS